MLVIENLKKKLEHFTLEIDRLEVEDRDYFVFLGLSGSGKTTLLEIIAGFRKPDSGKILIDGEDITNKPVNDRKVVMCHGKYLFPHMSVKDNIGYGIKDRRARERKIREVSRMLGIENLLNRKPETLSMGEQQRVALARALAVEPRVILLDEPLNSLDRLTHEALLLELREIYENSQLTFVHVTHDFIEAIALAKRMAVIRNGKIEQCGNVEEVLRKPENRFVAEFVGVKNLLKGRIIRENGSYVFDGGIRLHLDGECRCGEAVVGIRPEDIMVVSNENCRYGNGNVFSAKVVEIYPLSLSTVRVMLSVNGTCLVCEMLKSKALRMGLRKGRLVNACVMSAIPVECSEAE